MAFGDVGRGEFGTYFIGYAADPAVTEEMLENMFIGRPPGNTDRILDFSTAITGGLFFVPSADFLDNLPDSATATAASAAAGAPDVPVGPAGPAVTTAPVTPGSLGIGSLKGLRA
jgi:putative iron-dependent peroxidase